MGTKYRLSKLNLYLDFDLKNVAVFSNSSKALVLMSKDMLTMLRSTQPENIGVLANELQIGEEKILPLIKNKILIPSNVDEYMDYMKKINLFRDLRPVLSTTFTLTTGCNLNCVYCYEGKLSATPKTMSKKTIEKAIEFLPSYMAENGYRQLHVELYGGEPLLAKKQILYLMDAIDEGLYFLQPKDIYLAMTTNGTLLDDDIIDLLCSHNLKIVQLTIDGPKKIHNQYRPYKNGKGSFDDVMRSLKKITERGILAILRINVDEGNVRYIPELLDILSERTKGENIIINITPIMQIGRATTSICVERSLNPPDATEKIRSLNREAYKRSLPVLYRMSLSRCLFCSATSKGSLIFDADGKIHTCASLIGHPEEAIGDVFSDPVIDKKKQEMWASRNPMKIEECKNCPIVGFCGGGCAYEALTRNKDINKVFCPYFRYNYEAFLKEYVELKRKDTKAWSHGMPHINLHDYNG